MNIINLSSIDVSLSGCFSRKLPNKCIYLTLFCCRKTHIVTLLLGQRPQSPERCRRRRLR